MLPIKEIEDYVKSETKDVILVTHDFDHVKKVSVGAVWFVKVLGSSKEEQDLAYVAGLLHDIVRPDTEKICHARASAEKAKEILQSFNVEPKIIEKLVQAIRDHRLPVKWKSPLHQSVYLSDKIFEQMGAYVAFRRCMYVGECRDYKDIPYLEAIKKHFIMRIERIPKTDFPEKFSKLIDYQWKWLIEFVHALDKKEEWALNLAKQVYENGKTYKIKLEVVIKNFKPKFERDKEYKHEALNYIEGKKFREFEKLI